MLTLLQILALLVFFAIFFFGRYFRIGVCYLRCFNLLTSLFILILVFYSIKTNGVSNKIILTFRTGIDFLNVDWSFRVNSSTSITLVIVSLISLLDHIYSPEYMENDPYFFRFMGFLSLFTFFMLIIITSNNFLQMFVGLEDIGTGLALYLLITYWLTYIPTNKTAIKDMLVYVIVDMTKELFMFLTVAFIFFNLSDSIYDLTCELIPPLIDDRINIAGTNFYTIDFIFLLLITIWVRSSSPFR